MTRFSPLWLQAGSYAASVDRRLIGALWPQARATGGVVSATGAGMSVDVAPGSVAVPAPNGTGSVLCSWDAPETVTLNPAPPSGTNRVDLVVCQAYGQDIDGGTQDEFVIMAVAGAEAPSATPPALPPGAVALAQVAVAGGSASVVAGNITDRRPGSLAVPAGALVFPNAAARDQAIPAPALGMECWLSDTETPWAYREGRWRGIPLGVLGMADANGAWLHNTYVTVISGPAVTFKAGRRYRVSAWLNGGNVTAGGITLLDLRDWGNPENRRTIYNGWTAVGNVGGQYINVAGWLIWDPPTTQPRTFLIAGSQSAGEFRTGAAGVVIEDVGSP